MRPGASLRDALPGTACAEHARMDELAVAILAATASADLGANARLVAAAIIEAAGRGAQVLVTPECMLVGYPSAARASLGDVAWPEVERLEQELLAEARARGLLLLLGTAGRHPGGVSNQVLAGGAVAPVRYHKRCLTPIDRDHFVPGQEAVILAWGGWRLGVGICYDLRFPDVWMAMAARGVDGWLVSAHMAGPDPNPGTKRHVVPALCTVRAAETATPLAFANTAASDRYCDSACYDARGMPVVELAHGLALARLAHRRCLDPWYQGLHDTALARWRAAARDAEPAAR